MPPLTGEAARNYAERRLREEGWRFKENNAEGGRVFKYGPYSVAIPSRGWENPRVVSGVMRDVAVNIGRARRWAQSQKHGGPGMRPSDVEGWAPLGPPGPAQGAFYSMTPPEPEPAPVPATDEPLLEPTESAATEPSPAEPEPVPLAAAPGIEAPMTAKKKRTLTYQQCPVKGCSGLASGKHLASHKRRGELPKDFILRTPRTRDGAAPRRKVATPVAAPAVVGAAREYKELVDTVTSTLTKARSVVGDLMQTFDALAGTVGRLAEMAALAEENRKLAQADAAKYAELLEQMEQSFSVLRQARAARGLR